MELSIEKFDPTVAELQAISESAKSVVVTDFADKSQLSKVEETRKLLKQARVKITNQGKEMREQAVAFSKMVISKEKELIAIIEPEELRLKELEDEAERHAEARRNALALPLRRERLSKINDTLEISDADLNLMNSQKFEEYFTTRLQALAEEDRRKLAEKQAEIEAEERRQKEAREKAEAEEKARADERAKIAAEQQERAQKVEREAREKAAIIEREAIEKALKIEAEAKAIKQAEEERLRKETEQRIAKEKAEAEAIEKAKAEAAQRESSERYQKWIKNNTTSGMTYEEKDKGDVIELWQLVSTFKK